MKHYCPMCGEQWDEDVCASCGWREPPQALNAIADTVLAYKPKAKSEPAVQRKHHARKGERGGMAKSKSTVKANAKQRLLDTIESLVHCRANAGFFNGYRAAGKDTEDIRAKEMATWRRYTELRPRLDRALAAYVRACKEE